jgi:transposase
VADAAWLAELAEQGLLRGSFVPPPAIRQLRDLTRYPKQLIQAHTAETQRVHKTLEDAGSKLDAVAADVLGVSGRAMLAALVAGERDPVVLAELAKGKLRKQAAPAAPGAHGALQRPSRVAGRAVVGAPGALGAGHRPLDDRVDEVIAPFAVARDRLDTITGVGKRAAETIIADMRRRHEGVPHRWAPGVMGGSLPGQQPRPAANAAPARPPKATAGWARC